VVEVDADVPSTAAPAAQVVAEDPRAQGPKVDRVEAAAAAVRAPSAAALQLTDNLKLSCC
jgi:hypothetical protein